MNYKFVSLFLVFFSITLSSAAAFACGGLFCDNGPQMVNQAAEKIIFVKHDDGFVTAVVQVQYEGKSEEFGWIIPVPGIPEIGVSSNLAFARLQTQTNPTFQLTTTTEGECQSQGGFLGSQDSASGGNNGISPENKSGVVVAASGNVGPYDYVVIEIPNPKPNGAKQALEWLENNNYQAMEGSEELFQTYLDDGMNLIAFRLTKNADAGDIRPIVMKYKTDRPMIPIKLTAVAADDDMGVLVWVLGSERATPVNYRTLEINDTLIDWFNLNNYNDVIIRAANEAGGQGFVTEMVDETAILEDVIFREFERTEWSRIMSETYPDDGEQLMRDIERFLLDLNANCFQDCGIDDIDGVPIALENAFPQATQTTRDELADCLSCNVSLVQEGFDVERVRKAFDDWVTSPIIETQKLIDDQKYFSRFYTTLSAPEMTVDPIFDFNPKLENVTNQHVANRIVECDSSVSFQDAPWRTTLPSGLVVRGAGRTWPIPTDDPEFSANIIIRQGSTSDNPVVRDNIATIRKNLDLRNADIAAAGGCAGCSSTKSNNLPTIFILLALLFGVRRKRQN